MARLRAEDAERRVASGHGPDFLEAFARGLRVIGAFGREKRHMTLSDVARATDLPKPSVRRALHTLTCLGMAASDGRTYRLTPRIMELASAYLGSNMVSTIVQPACERIGDRTEQSCFAAVLDGYDIVMIAHSLHGRPDVLAPTIGLRRPAFNTAAGRAILSQLTDEVLGRLARQARAQGHDGLHRHRQKGAARGDPAGAPAGLCRYRPGAAPRLPCGGRAAQTL